MSEIEDLTVSLRREVEAGNYAEAAAIASKLARLRGDPEENDKSPLKIPAWGCLDA
jgi:hypothetical protein